MKTKQKVDMVINSFLIVIGILIVILASLRYNEVKTIFIGVMYAYALLNLIQFILTRKDKDYEGLYTFLASCAVGTIDLFYAFTSTKVLIISIMSWVIMMSVIKFIKTDYYNDRKDKMYKLRIATLLLFIIVGILVSLSLNYSTNVQVMVIGYFFLIHGILELIDPITKYLIGK